MERQLWPAKHVSLFSIFELIFLNVHKFSCSWLTILHWNYFLFEFTACSEAYTVTQDRDACKAGCNYMSKQRISDLLSLLSVAVYVEENVGIDTNALLMSPEIPETDILTDPSLRKELLPGWWDSDGFKLPQTFVKTVPMDSGVRRINFNFLKNFKISNELYFTISNWVFTLSNHRFRNQQFFDTV